MTRTHWLSAIALVAATGLAAPIPVSVAKTRTGASHTYKLHEDVHKTFDVGKTPRLALSNVNGDVEVTGGSGTTIEVTAVKSADSQKTFDDMEVSIEQDGDDVRVKVHYKHHDDWDNDSPSRVDFTVQVPRGTRLEDVSLVNGELDLKDIDGRIQASSVNGSVEGEGLAGNLDLSTVNGDVTLAVSGGMESIKLHSVNGTVSLSLPRNVDANLSANTIHGDIRGSREFHAEERHFVGSSLTSVIGKGGGHIDLNTVNGDIRIHREGARDESDSRDAD
jgi:DUF4097 and DUF4098 domain-containing protein YvlB